MDPDLDIPCEKRLSNSLIKSRPNPRRKTKALTTTYDVNPVSSDDAKPVEHSGVQSPPMTLVNVDGPVVFRQKNSLSSNRQNDLDSLTKVDAANPFHPSNTTLFYITSATPDHNSMTHSNSSSTSDQPSLTRGEERNSFVVSEYYSLSSDEVSHHSEVEPMNQQASPVSVFIDDFARTSLLSTADASTSNRTTIYLEKVRENTSNCRCADCDADSATIAIMSWLLVICKKCAAVHRRITSDFLRLQSLFTIACDPHLIELLYEYGNQFANSLLENQSPGHSKPTDQSNDLEREQYIRKKYLEKIYLQPYHRNRIAVQDELDTMLYENVETSDYGKTLHLLMLGANPNYSVKMFSVADHAKRHQQTKQMKIILANGGLSDFDFMKSSLDDTNESTIYLSTKHGVLKEFLTRYESNHLKIYALSSNPERSQQCLSDIDLSNILTICNEPAHGVSLKCRLSNASTPTVNCQCTLVVNDQSSTKEYVCVFTSELERSVWIREILKREYSYHQLIYPDFLLLMKVNVQEGINAEKQQVIAIVYSGRFVICSDTVFDEVDLRKYSSLTHQKSPEFTGVLLCLVSNRFLYLSSPISKSTNLLYSCLQQAIKVRSLTDLNQQILTSQNIPVIVERFVNFIFKYGLQTKGIYRQAGQESKVRQLLNDCLDDPFTQQLSRENYSEHDVANALKRFLRHLEVPLLGTRQDFHAWLRTTIDTIMTEEQLIQCYRALIKDLKRRLPIHHATLRTMLIHMHTVAALADRNGMTMSNLISTFAPCLVSQDISVPLDYKSERARRQSIASISSLSQFPISSAYVHVTPSIQSMLTILTSLCKYYRELFDVTYEEIEHEKHCIETLISAPENQSIPYPADGAMISVYFESRADELNGYAMKIFEQETTADMIIDKLLVQIGQGDCFFWTLFEVIIDQSLERPMYSCENISEVLHRYRTYLSHDLNRQAALVVKLNYVQFEKERLDQRQNAFNNQSVQCEYFDVPSQRWVPCVWSFEKAVLQIHRVSGGANDRSVRWKSTVALQDLTSSVSVDQLAPLHAWSIEDLFFYIGADCRFVTPFDMNDYRVLTILPVEIIDDNPSHSPFGVSFRFAHRNQMFSWYLELTHVSGHDKWTRRASRTLPNGISYLPLQNFHTPPSSALVRKKSDLVKNKFIAKSCHVASNLCRQLRK